ncbi:SMP-30/gluconolactonase/LRE family protein [Pseudoxanthomonas dokdonensis]|uniref:Gluconolactonase n=1 Tax=Pseudoxanthomonas dokdonensis TaxID=344882 RepID=A0A0R0CGH8_9GAMM|nr:SMP-30/gluconolactonase/LRE family protein [Pseudoxanthomonas dokdonensis]KRG68496.1 gluconolactonase [Pseudoxanthomonas dokdonensis]
MTAAPLPHPKSNLIAGRLLLATLASMLAACSASPPASVPPAPAVTASSDHRVIGGTRRWDARFEQIVPADAVVEQLAQGFNWAEGPAWDAGNQQLLFTDVPENTLYRWSADNTVAVLMKPSGYQGNDFSTLREAGANGIWLQADGQWLIADSGSRAIVRVDPASGKRTLLVSDYQGKRFNSPNDLVVRGDSIFFTDPAYGLKGINDSPARELAYSGVYRLDRDGSVHLLEDELLFPNGIALSPDQNTLYVSNSDPQRPVWMAYTLAADGSVLARREFANAADLVAQGAPGLPDGMKVAPNGLLFASAPGGVLVMDADGQRLGRIETGGPISNCAFGNDGRMLYLTSKSLLARIRVTPRALGFPAP